MHGFKIDCFGVGDGAACGDRNHSSYLYTFPKTSFLIDCGEPVSRTFKNTGLSYDAIDRIILSHLHFDHIGGFFMLLQGFWLDERRKDLPILLPPEGIKPVTEMLQAGYLFEELLDFKFSFEPLEAGKPLHWDGVRVTPFHTTHLDSFRRRFGAKYPGPFAAFCFLIEADGLRIAHSADLGAPSDLEPLLRSPLNLLVCEVAHFPPEAIFNYLRGREIERIAFTHLGRPYWEKFEETQALAARLLPGADIVFPKDHAQLIA